MDRLAARERDGSDRLGRHGDDRETDGVAAWIGPWLSRLGSGISNEVIRDSGARCVGCEERRPRHGVHHAIVAAPFFKAVWATARRRRRAPAGARPGAVVQHRRQLHSAPGGARRP
ncbi:MAG: hypothetical protein JNK64_04990 [Myxococcales bacterium]|nr:hypothetical protein [Myxococcales bacterium]